MNIFKAYDVRGKYPQEINEKVAYEIGRAFIKFLNSELKIPKNKLQVVIGRDNRLSSLSLYKNLIKGIVESEANIIDIGLATTPMFYFTICKFKYDGGIMTTASHNPPSDNGFKLVKRKAVTIDIDENGGLKEIKKMVLGARRAREIRERSELNFPVAERSEAAVGGGRKASVQKKKVLKDYLNLSLSKVNLKKIKPFKVAMDTGNGVTGILISEILKRKLFKVYPLFIELDGTFPNHLPNPSEEINISYLKKFVKKKKLDLGVAFDGDGDRIILVDENGKVIPSDFISCLFSKIILKENKGAKILYNICSSNIIKDIIEENGGKAIVSKVGRTFIKEKAQKEKAVFATEFSGHFYFKDNWFSEEPFFLFFKILEEMADTKKTISQLVSPFNVYFHSGQINLEVKDKKRTLEALEKKFKNNKNLAFGKNLDFRSAQNKVSHLDGVRIDFSDWWFNARPSNTENLLRVVVEAKTKKKMEEKLKEIRKIINKT
ncbi:hypothetical protein COS93_01390 [bacterium (Candidatus Gribaldobacteria) CG07_land_8_20_14_0_80_33_18]|uniref:Phosphomannomutase/phosphoglucomutase n=1 Tax=bacterium (Candidatus Gribaldobacteria) CG07_land_8_20_14_0_80_33_18 TaxID=2014272 RepID=A0A2M6Z3D0_9BACT|nr:MAG: hypothetical protein COU04_01250 [bacterium (Candidatus Gribaldobacteria) CG10_big_fil_rev_8_21_14_0_10_33_41]PIU46890.1 MAG: hypothetical protein COS93_01390 [bacterium (Candidatus Gribaldobacteria) CG07_land_8_20_14_0_80_33_18]PJA01131.1 MAG: hypothetical protein COX75_00650 [bacterium (Candidatus Gribaldobacteria) CG_4_10_14_0_2_um_filter_33_15]PJB08809.1 MAG: hypothetical protein CO122_00760 [bacterium (Candidatus Gribaldobacteria) CG_4_9_14_3_um_filter_33_9]